MSSPTNPRIVAKLDSQHGLRFYVSGTYAYVADYAAGLQVVDINNPQTFLGRRRPGVLPNAFRENDLAYVAASNLDCNAQA